MSLIPDGVEPEFKRRRTGPLDTGYFNAIGLPGVEAVNKDTGNVIGGYNGNTDRIQFTGDGTELFYPPDAVYLDSGTRDFMMRVKDPAEPSAVKYRKIGEIQRFEYENTLGLNFVSRQEFVDADLSNVKFGSVATDGRFFYLKTPDPDKQNVIPDKGGWVPYGERVDVGHFGGDYSGTSNSTPAFQAAIDYVSSLSDPRARRVYCSGGTGNNTLKIEGQGMDITTDDVIIDLDTCVIDASDFDQTPRERAVFNFKGPGTNEADKTTLSENMGYSTDRFSVTDADFPAEDGDLVLIRSGGYNVYKDKICNEIRRVYRDNSTSYRTEDRVSWGYPAGAEVFLLRPLKRCQLLGGRIVGGYYNNYPNGFGQSGVYGEYCDEFTLRGCRIQGFENKGVEFLFSYQCKFYDFEIHGHPPDFPQVYDEGNTSGYYGIWTNHSTHSHIRNLVGYRTRHLKDGNYETQTLVENVTSFHNHKAAFTCHDSTSHDCVFRNCSAYSTVDGGFMLWRSSGSVTYENCRCVATNGCLHSPAPGATDLPTVDEMPRRRLVWKNCHFVITRPYEAINTAFTGDSNYNLDVDVIDSTFIRLGTRPQDFRYQKRGAVYFGQFGEGNRYRVIGCTIKTLDASEAALFSEDGGDSLMIRDCVFASRNTCVLIGSLRSASVIDLIGNTFVSEDANCVRREGNNFSDMSPFILRLIGNSFFRVDKAELMTNPDNRKEMGSGETHALLGRSGGMVDQSVIVISDNSVNHLSADRPYIVDVRGFQQRIGSGNVNLSTGDIVPGCNGDFRTELLNTTVNGDLTVSNGSTTVRDLIVNAKSSAPGEDRFLRGVVTDSGAGNEGAGCELGLTPGNTKNVRILAFDGKGNETEIKLIPNSSDGNPIIDIPVDDIRIGLEGGSNRHLDLAQIITDLQAQTTNAVTTGSDASLNSLITTGGGTTVDSSGSIIVRSVPTSFDAPAGNGTQTRTVGILFPESPRAYSISSDGGTLIFRGGGGGEYRDILTLGISGRLYSDNGGMEVGPASVMELNTDNVAIGDPGGSNRHANLPQVITDLQNQISNLQNDLQTARSRYYGTGAIAWGTIDLGDSPITIQDSDNMGTSLDANDSFKWAVNRLSNGEIEFVYPDSVETTTNKNISIHVEALRYAGNAIPSETTFSSEYTTAQNSSRPAIILRCFSNGVNYDGVFKVTIMKNTMGLSGAGIQYPI